MSLMTRWASLAERPNSSLSAEEIGLKWDLDRGSRVGVQLGRRWACESCASRVEMPHNWRLRYLGPLWFCDKLGTLTINNHRQSKLICLRNGSRGTVVARAMGRSSLRSWALGSIAAPAALGMAPAAWAGIGQPSPGQLGMQGAVTEVAEGIHAFHDLVNTLIIAIAVFVGILLLYVIFRFNEKSNPTPSRTTHHTMLELVWTVIPILILVVIAVPSFKLLYLQYSYPKPDLTIKAIGNAWFWEHEYPDYDGLTVTSNILRDEDLLRAERGDDEFNKRYGDLTGVERTRRLYNDAAPLWAK